MDVLGEQYNLLAHYEPIYFDVKEPRIIWNLPITPDAKYVVIYTEPSFFNQLFSFEKKVQSYNIQTMFIASLLPPRTISIPMVPIGKITLKKLD